MKPSFFLIIFAAVLISCSPSSRFNRSARNLNRSARSLAKEPALANAQVGIAVYDPLAGRYLCDYGGDKYFVPASNTKLATCYAAMKHLGDSLEGMRYVYENDSVVTLFPTGDPSLGHEGFKYQPVWEFLHRKGLKFYLSQEGWQEEALGSGWSWNDYTEDYMAERSAMPIHGNVAKFTVDVVPGRGTQAAVDPALFSPILNTMMTKMSSGPYSVSRPLGSNAFFLVPSKSKSFHADIPFVTNDDSTAVAILRYDGIDIERQNRPHIPGRRELVIHSQPVDSVLKPMMHHSDNFFAEQSLLMVSNTLLQVMNDERVIDTLLRSDLADLPQKPRWVDGSGLSRYNLFTPQDMVTILDHMRRDFGMARIQNILATGGEGTLSNYYINERGYIWAKTGTLSGAVALSGIVMTKNKHYLIFSVLVNNNQSSATSVRRTVEGFIKQLRERY